MAAEADGKGIGRIRLRHIPDASADSLHGFVVDSIEAGSTVHTDGWQGYQVWYMAGGADHGFRGGARKSEEHLTKIVLDFE